MKRSVKILSLLVAVCLCLAAFSACGEGKAVMTLGDKALSQNVYSLLLSRMKGTLYSYGYDVDNESFWKTIISADGMTYDDYFSISIMEEASRYLISDYLFDEMELELPEECVERVDLLMNAMVKQAGSKTSLNGILKDFGVNYSILRDTYLLEEKISILKDHLYGEKAEKISAEEKEKYMRENYVAFSQIFLASYYYLVDIDRFGDEVYYTDEKHTAISYDKEGGETRTDEFGRTITDIFGAPEYFSAEGRIAYDKEGGVKGYVTDEDGSLAVGYYDDERLGELFDRAARYAEECNGDYEKFLEYVRLYDESEGEGEMNCLFVSAGYYGSQGEDMAYLDEIALGLQGMKTGECQAAQSDFGFHIFFKLELDEGAYADESKKETFSDFSANLIEKLFDEECAKYEAMIEIDQDSAESAATMATVGTNLLY